MSTSTATINTGKKRRRNSSNPKKPKINAQDARLPEVFDLRPLCAEITGSYSQTMSSDNQASKKVKKELRKHMMRSPWLISFTPEEQQEKLMSDGLNLLTEMLKGENVEELSALRSLVRGRHLNDSEEENKDSMISELKILSALLCKLPSHIDATCLMPLLTCLNLHLAVDSSMASLISILDSLNSSPDPKQISNPTITPSSYWCCDVPFL